MIYCEGTTPVYPIYHYFCEPTYSANERPCIDFVVLSKLNKTNYQIREMNERDVSAVYVGDANDEVGSKVCNGKYQVYLSPAHNTTWRDMLESSVYQQNLVAFVVDKAHVSRIGQQM